MSFGKKNKNKNIYLVVFDNKDYRKWQKYLSLFLFLSVSLIYVYMGVHTHTHHTQVIDIFTYNI